MLKQTVNKSTKNTNKQNINQNKTTNKPQSKTQLQIPIQNNHQKFLTSTTIKVPHSQSIRHKLPTKTNHNSTLYTMTKQT